MRVDGARPLRRIDELARLGALEGGGCYRPLYSVAWMDALELVTAWMLEAGLVVRRDAVGNLWGRLEGAGGMAVATGSHIDTVRGGGALDGAYGVIAAVEAASALRGARGRPARPLEVVAICEEEGSRFATTFWGSRAIAGRISDDETAVTDADGTSIASAMLAHRLDPTAVGSAKRSDLGAFLELHIEQGAVLHEQGPRLGIVTAIAGTWHLEVTVRGQPDHAGAAAMGRRRDALIGASAMVQAIANIATRTGPPAVATVGRIAVEPAQLNVVPGLACFTVDARHSDPERFHVLADEIVGACVSLGRQFSLEVEVGTLRERGPVALDPELIALARRACVAVGVEPRELVSGAGHDAQILAGICPAATIFVPSIGGRSHCPEEATRPEDLVLGARALAAALEELAY